MQNRDYQQRAEEAIFSQWEKVRATAIVMATGTGKTHVFANVIKRLGRPALVLAHRKELIEQAARRIEQITELPCGIEMANVRAQSDWYLPPVVIATVQTLNSGKETKRMHQWKPDAFGLVVVDEFHHSTADTYRQVLNYFSGAKVLGVTATIDRADKEDLSQVCESKAFSYDILDGVNDGWLVPVTQQFCPVSSLDFSEVRTSNGDLHTADLSTVMEAKRNVQGVCHPSLEVLYGLQPKTLSGIPLELWTDYLTNLPQKPRRAIVFTVSVKQAEDCAALLNGVVPGIAEWVCGTTPKDEREEILERFATGKTAVVCNCGVLTEGYDNPGVEVIIMARPTKSRALYTQMVGRSTRTLPGLVDGLPTAEERKAAIAASSKPLCRIIDFAGNSGRHKLICALDILSGQCSPENVERAIGKAKKEGKPVIVTKALDDIQLDIIKEQRMAFWDSLQRTVCKSEFEMVDVDPFKEKRRAEHDWEPHKGKMMATDKQRRVIGRAGIYPHGWTKRQASMIIGLLANNNWRLPLDKRYDWIRKWDGGKKKQHELALAQ